MKKILIVEDSVLHQKMYDMVLGVYRSKGVEIFNAANGLEALALLSAHPDTDLVILDINMPGMSGLECLRRMKAEEAFQAIPAIICSTEGKDEDIVRGLRAGAAGYVKKPFFPAQLLDLIARVVAAK